MEIHYFQYLQIFCLFTAVFCYRGLRAFRLTAMIPLLLLVCVVELLAINYLALGLSNNYGIYNIYIGLSPFIYFIIFQQVLRFRKTRLIIYIAVVLLTAAFIIYDYFYLEPGRPMIYTILVALMEHLILSFIVLAVLVTEEQRKVELTNEPWFWIAAGLIVFALVGIVVLGLQPFLYRYQVKLLGKSAYAALMPMANVVLYGCYTYAFYLCRKHRTTFLLSSSR